MLVAVEQDEWASKQSITALGLVLIDSVVDKLVSTLKVWCSWIEIKDYDSMMYKLIKYFTKTLNIINDVVGVLVIVLIIIALFNVIKQKNAGVPVVERLSSWAYGVLIAPSISAPANPVAPAAGQFCNSCGAKIEGGKFCLSCGKPVE